MNPGRPARFGVVRIDRVAAQSVLTADRDLVGQRVLSHGDR